MRERKEKTCREERTCGGEKVARGLKRLGLIGLCLLALFLSGTGAGAGELKEASTSESAEVEESAKGEESAKEEETYQASGNPEPVEVGGLCFDQWMDFSYAQCVRIGRSEEGYRLIEVSDGRSYLLVPEGKTAPEGLEGEVIILPCPLERIYLAATSAMALFSAANALDHIRLSSLSAENWYVPAAREAMERGEILFAGKYSEPDFERLLEEDCQLAIESTMILHTPKVQEMIEDLGIPVLIDRSSYEDHPLGRSEWVKVYGVLTGHEEEAKAFFEEQAKVMEDLRGYENTGERIAFFSVNSRGQIVVREPTDYVPKMIELAGARYVPEFSREGEEETRRSTLTMTMEEFYALTIDADYLVYNASIEEPLGSIEELLDKNPLFADFEAVKKGQVYCTDRYLYQATDIVGTLIRDFHGMISGEEEGLVFLTHLS